MFCDSKYLCVALDWRQSQCNSWICSIFLWLDNWKAVILWGDGLLDPELGKCFMLAFRAYAGCCSAHEYNVQGSSCWSYSWTKSVDCSGITDMIDSLCKIWNYLKGISEAYSLKIFAPGKIDIIKILWQIQLYLLRKGCLFEIMSPGRHILGMLVNFGIWDIIISLLLL